LGPLLGKYNRSLSLINPAIAGTPAKNDSIIEGSNLNASRAIILAFLLDRIELHSISCQERAHQTGVPYSAGSVYGLRPNVSWIS
jgi:hypothetical protein